MTIAHFAPQVGIADQWRQAAGAQGFGDQVVGQAGVDRHPATLHLDQAEVIAGLAAGGGPLDEEHAPSRQQQFAQPPRVGEVGADGSAIDLHRDPEAVVAVDEPPFDQVALDLHRRLGLSPS